MGRYYNGDIEGKFWLGVQPSDDASFFGGQESEPNYRDYYFAKDNLPELDPGIAKCVDALGENKAKLDAFFGAGGEGYNGYTDKMVADALGIPCRKNETFNKDVNDALQWYARLQLGEKIRSCVHESGECSFEAEMG
jgi:hypothetical protein